MRAADPLVRGCVVRPNVSLATSCGSHGIMARVPGVEVSSSAPRLFVPPCSFLLGRQFHFSVKKAKIQEHFGSAAFFAIATIHLPPRVPCVCER